MPPLKLTKSAVDSARPEARDYELRDTIIPGFFCKITPAGRKVFKRRYRRRSRFEIMFGRLKDRRRVATRYDRFPAAFFSAVALPATVILWL